MSDLLDDLLAMPVGPKVRQRQATQDDFTRSVEVRGGAAEVVLRGPEGDVGESEARALLLTKGLDPSLFEVSGFRSSEWTMANGETGVSNRFTFRKVEPRGCFGSDDPDFDALCSQIAAIQPTLNLPDGEYGYIVALGDMQLGKMDGDGPAGTVERTLRFLANARDQMLAFDQLWPIGQIHIAWLGDHIEGFVSQGGANVWRTVLTTNEQIRLVRRIMTEAMVMFAPYANKLTMVAVPGNHGEPQRFAGKGVTRYDDSHDTEALVCVSEIAAQNSDAFGHVEFFVPEADELTVVLDVAGTTVAHAHGHQWRGGKHFDWWKGQALHHEEFHAADVLLSGHLHHYHAERDGGRTFLQVPAIEAESTWFRHRTGSPGSPGLVLAVTKDGQTNHFEVIQ